MAKRYQQLIDMIRRDVAQQAASWLDALTWVARVTPWVPGTG